MIAMPKLIRPLGTLLALLAIITGIILSAPPSLASTTSAEPTPGATSSAPAEPFQNRISGVLRNADGPVAGVRITATGEGFSGEATTGENGTWSIGVPVQGTYQVKVDVSTFPEGVKLAAGTPNPREVTFTNTSNAAAVFPLGEGIVVQSASFGEIFVERLIAGLELRPAARPGFGGPVPDLRHHRPDQLRPRRDGHARGSRDVRFLRGGSSDLVGAVVGCRLRRRPSAGSRTRGSGSRCGAGVLR